jgi:hypothetical protein
MPEIPSDYVQEILEKIMEAKIATLNTKIDAIDDKITGNHREVKELLTTHTQCCTSNMNMHDNRIRQLFSHKDKVTGALIVIGSIVTIISGFLIAHFA